MVKNNGKIRQDYDAGVQVFRKQNYDSLPVRLQYYMRSERFREKYCHRWFIICLRHNERALDQSSEASEPDIQRRARQEARRLLRGVHLSRQQRQQDTRRGERGESNARSEERRV